MMCERRTIEVNGIKLEVDMSTARRIDTFRVGDNVKLLKKADSYNSAKVFAGIITSFDNFKDSPSITVAYVKPQTYGCSPNIEFVYLTKDNTEFEMVLASDDEIKLSGDGVIESFERMISQKENEASELREKLAYFKKYFLGEE